MIEQKISTKKNCRGIEQLREAYSSRKKKDKTVSFLENGSEKILEQSPVERDYKAKHKIGLGKPRTIALSRIKQTQ